MTEYESVFVLHPKVDDAGIDHEIEATKETIATGGGEVIGVHKWGRRKLAYPIKKVNEGYYVILRFNGEAEILPELDRKYKLNEQVIRHLVVHSPGGQWPPELKGRERRGPRRDGPGGGRGHFDRDRDRDRGDRDRGRGDRDRDRGDIRPPAAKVDSAPAAPAAEAPAPAPAAPPVQAPTVAPEVKPES